MVSVGRVTVRQHPLEEIFDVVEELYQEFVVVNLSSGACDGIGFGAGLGPFWRWSWEFFLLPPCQHFLYPQDPPRHPQHPIPMFYFNGL